MTEREIFIRHMAQTSDEPLGLEISHSAGVYMYDKSGKKYIDLISGIGPSLLGHNNPAIIEAIKAQTDKYLHTLVYGEFILSPQAKLTRMLIDLLPPKLNNVYLLSTGTEATELAMKLSKRVTGRREIVAMNNSYHGSTQGALSLMSDDYFSRPFRPLLPGIRFIEFNRFEDIELITEESAAVIMEVIKAESGIHTPAPGYLQAVRQRCNDTGTLLVFDEIQSAYARTGSLFAFEQYEVVPDILLLGKSFGGGMPLAACISSKQIMEKISYDPVLGHITTYGGHPLSCAAAIAALEQILQNDLLKEVQRKAGMFTGTLKHQSIVELRSAGLWMALEFDSPALLRRIIRSCLQEGLIVDWFLFNDKSMRIAPPLTISEKEIEDSCQLILKVLDKL